ncbi:methylated-DNA--[protein]-cysteine S-methyltransferase [Sodalis sp. RH21]|uniref:methylated-DNA--[protein]-cysteine S-methyltransferase n=1 Tax=unclassified Sodalis (in: enterobacteria) TaxID=2636512 RepID=UPI0039B368E2
MEIPAPAEIAGALDRYFSGEPKALDVLRTETAGTELQRRVWGALRRIPTETTTTYGKLAKELGFDGPRAAIDVGAANGANPIAIIVPCVPAGHQVAIQPRRSAPSARCRADRAPGIPAWRWSMDGANVPELLVGAILHPADK